MNKVDLAIVIPVKNESKNLKSLVTRIAKALKATKLVYKMIFVDDHSQDGSVNLLKKLQINYPIEIYTKKGLPGKAYSIIEGASYSKARYIAMIDADLQYPPEVIPKMISRLKNADIVVANRDHYKIPIYKKFLHSVLGVFTKLLYGFDVDVQSGLKVFKRNVVRHITVSPGTKNFDLEFLVRAESAGYVIDSVDVTFQSRTAGTVKSSPLKRTSS